MKYAIENGMIDLSYVEDKMQMDKEQKILKNHPGGYWQNPTDKYYRTYLPGENGRRRLVKKKQEEDIRRAIIQYWEEQKQNTFKNRFAIWAERQKKCGRSDNTIYKYEKDYDRFFKGEKFENMDIREINEEDISEHISLMLSKKKIPYRALKAIFGYMNGTFEKAIVDKKIDKNPCRYVDLLLFKQYCTEPPKKTAIQRTLSKEEKQCLLNKVQKNETIIKYAIEFSLYTGMRVGELSGLKWSDIDEKLGIITICRSEKYNRKTKEYFISATKNDKIRKIPITDNIRDVLARIKEKEIEQGYISEFVFSGENGRVHAKAITDRMRRVTTSEDFSCPKSIHAIRRTLNSNMRCMGVSPTVAAALLGHTENVNERNYTYDISSMDEKLHFMEKAGEIF